MAIYHFSVKLISRSKGRSATAAAAYRDGTQIMDERTGERHDYRRKRGVLHGAILTPARAPSWAKDSATLWNEVEKTEKRKDAQLAREVVVALPHELSLEQNKMLLHGYVQEHFVKRGMAAQINIHAPDRDGDERNVHAHILLTTRQITRNGFKDKKPTSWNTRETLQEWREGWAEHLNRALEKAQVKERVDHRSHEGQGIEREPTKHLGPEATQMERRGEKSRIGDENRAAENGNRTLSRLEQEEKEIAAAIAEEMRRLMQQEAQERQTQKQTATTEQRQEAQAQRLYELELQQLDERRQLEDWAGSKRQTDERELAETYGRRETQKELRQARAELHRAESGFIARITGKAAQAREEVGISQQRYVKFHRIWDF